MTIDSKALEAAELLELIARLREIAADRFKAPEYYDDHITEDIASAARMLDEFASRAPSPVLADEGLAAALDAIIRPMLWERNAGKIVDACMAEIRSRFLTPPAVTPCAPQPNKEGT